MILPSTTTGSAVLPSTSTPLTSRYKTTLDQRMEMQQQGGTKPYTPYGPGLAGIMNLGGTTFPMGSIPEALATQMTSSSFLSSQSSARSNLPQGFHMGPGGSVTTSITGKNAQAQAAKYSKLAKTGQLGSLTETAAWQIDDLMRRTQVFRDAYKAGGPEPMAHTAPKTGGTFVLGSMQGSRLRAFERRQARKAEAAKKDDLVRVETKEHLQREAPEVKAVVR